MPVRWKNSATQYGMGGRVLHWLSVALLVTMIVTALPFEEMEASPEKMELIRRHVSYGLVFLLVMGMRVYWRRTNVNPVLSYDIRNWQKVCAVNLHRLIYVVVITQALTGIASLVSGGAAIPFFDVFEIPRLSGRREGLYDLFTETHHFISVIIYPLFALHITAAIYHQIFGVRDD